MYRVIKSFTDLHDDDYLYQVGDEFPRPGIRVLQKRLDELASDQNRQGTPLIQKEEQEEAESEG